MHIRYIPFNSLNDLVKQMPKITKLCLQSATSTFSQYYTNAKNDSFATKSKFGYVVVDSNKKPIAISIASENHDLYEYMVYVVASYRRAGLGKRLFNKTKKDLFTKKSKNIRVYPWDSKSTAFYQKLGMFHKNYENFVLNK
jgi:ribosomal protein S18 acetylase RimI-like enzyme